MRPEFWRDKRVLITGHTGFKGSWLSLWLQTLGANLRGVALTPPTKPALFQVARVAEGMSHCITDIRNYELVKEQMCDFKPEIVFHLAAQPLVRLSYQRPLETYTTNVMGTIHVLEASRLCGSVKSIVNVTSDKCYENREIVWGYRENDSMGGDDPYSSSKGCAELVSAAYRKSFLAHEGIAMATARAGNVIGGGDWANDRLVPDILLALEKHKTVQIRNPASKRPWQHVLEALYGYLLLAENLHTKGQEFAEGWNFGPLDNDVRSVKWIVERLCDVWGNDIGWAVQKGSHPHEANYLKLDISMVKQRLNWAPRWSLDTALINIVSWHKAWLAGQDMRAKTLQQIQAFQELDQ